MVQKEGEYKIGTISRLSGFTPEVLRSWERRHGLLSPQRGEGGQRLYTRDDLAILQNVRRLLAEGLRIGEIIRFGRERLLVPPQGEDGAEAPLLMVTAVPPGILQSNVETVIAQFVDDITYAAVKLDKKKLEESLATAFAIFSQEVVIHDVIRKSAIRIGELWQRRKCSVAGEHLATATFERKILAIQEYRRQGLLEQPQHTAFCACFPEEQHAMGALMVACHLAGMALDIVYLDAALPFVELEAAFSSVPSALVCLSTSQKALFDKHKDGLLKIAHRWRGKMRFFVGGQGVPQADPDLAEAGIVLCHGEKSIREYPPVFFTNLSASV